ncbi:DNA-binding domain-containing protein [Variovorax defluvii]|uniref:DNA-binding domain-containing protein n=1 Tax=Variovorax defluvii TaxID=913761 RepID=A0ABP8HTV2_9BURK
MLALPDTQVRMMNALLRRGDLAAATHLVRPGALPATRRLAIYRNNMVESLVAALRAVYPVSERLVGTAFFRQAARACIGLHPSRSGDLHEFGVDFPAFLRAWAPAFELPYLPDVAALEWAVHRAYHEAALPPLWPASLAAVPLDAQPGLRLSLQPSARFLCSPYPVLRIWLANQPGADETETVSLAEGGVRLLVMQQALEVVFVPLGDAELRWLCALHEGAGLGEACARALDLDGAFDIGGALGRHLALGLFTGMAT